MVAACAVGLAILYPFTPIGVVSATAQQATLTLLKIQQFIELYPAILPNINVVGREPVVIARDRGYVKFKNGSSIESYSISSIIGTRKKILLVDELPRIPEQALKQNALPTTNFTRDVCLTYGYPDFESKVIGFTSACRKSNYFYDDFCKAYNAMINGNNKIFACALNYRSAVRVGITKADFFEERKRELPESIFATEYESIFVGEEEGSLFPYNLTQEVRTLKKVEYAEPRGSTSYYVLSLDIATSSAKNSDNSVLTLLKCTDRDDGTIIRQVVFIRSFNGKRLDELAEEVRQVYVRFPNIKKIIFDQRGLGDSFPLFFQTPWTSDDGKEYPPWCLDTEPSHMAEPLLCSFKANLQLNQELVNALRVAIEQKTLILPIDVRTMEETIIGAGIPLAKEEQAIYAEADALQYELGNLVAKTSDTTGNVTYSSARSTQHKDRYSSLAMGNWIISVWQAERKKLIQSRNRGETVIGLVSNF